MWRLPLRVRCVGAVVVLTLFLTAIRHTNTFLCIQEDEEVADVMLQTLVESRQQ